MSNLNNKIMEGQDVQVELKSLAMSAPYCVSQSDRDSVFGKYLTSTKFKTNIIDGNPGWHPHLPVPFKIFPTFT